MVTGEDSKEVYGHTAEGAAWKTERLFLTAARRSEEKRRTSALEERNAE